MLQRGTILSNRYEIIEKIGAGGMSIVYKAKCNKLHRYVAIKVLREEFASDEEFVSRFRVEAQSAASLSHPNIVSIYDVGYEDHIHYIVMEYIHGKTLKQIIEEEAPFTSERVLSVAMDIASALQHAHKKNIIHRDIKPQNILITDEGVLKVADFGIARAVDSSTVVTTGNAIGSVHYFSPEQARGGYIDKTSDIYSLGIVMYEMGTKMLPFEGESPVTVALKHINEDIPSPRSYNTELSTSLEDIIIKATQKKPENRYRNIDEMIKDMEQSLQHPNGSFVKIPDIENSPTIQMSEQDMKLLRGDKKNSINENKEEVDKKEQVPEEKDPREKWVTAGAVFTAFILIFVISAIGIKFIQSYLEPKVVAVPSLVNLDIEEAKALLEEKELILKVSDEAYHDEIPEGKIIMQDPEEGTIINLNSEVEVVVSKGVQTVEVPDVENRDYAYAKSMLEDLGLYIRRDAQYNDSVDENIVISQEPKAGTMLKAGEMVILTVSLGPEIKTVIVPNLLNLTEQAAKNQLINSGLGIGQITYIPHSDVAKGYVVSQSIQAGETVKEGYKVGFVVSEGKEEQQEPSESQHPNESPSTGPVEKHITILAPLDSNTDTFHVRVRLNGENNFIYEQTHSISDFPLDIAVTGEGTGYIEVYMNDDIYYRESIDFE
ncbi:Stk1 family PASTA domain-containing Ser/Thr kinase [Defluviitalea raffinosedens]|jgi:serine/threonine-protein kinase|uniref:non-specific serine/threonine protein kinase n=1 Tax=Defluviitalea raffinosedens TaxID=1450156 RepID=A0A7C8LEI0_9FIRM|nr:Stk1 family PASTA domain-containing Ser/Thr kinase [Defluviitalea raffinosedens]KAE9637201.1 Stk1 family PASTA domain-containing Ser/Thr kinase [Defluviitalea raffinosedens]MBM7685499.1 serine/threonine-protein kinase [Defluviitalea raffinosedens]HHW66772.1 Stk1 family PASTA domain-containing Ser/Thr kinase [Candidatus Epulonipiscium sp.]